MVDSKAGVQFQEMRSREDLFPGTDKVELFLSDLAVNGRVAVVTQNSYPKACLEGGTGVFPVWAGGFVTSNLGLRNSAFPCLPCFDWKSQPPRGFLRADKEPRQECPRFRASAAQGIKPPKATHS